MKKSDQVPKQMLEVFNIIKKETDLFCEQYLNDEYKQLIHLIIAALCRKRPSPLLKGKVNAWATGIVHAAGTANFLFDKSQIPHCTVTDIYTYFGVSSSTGQGKSKVVRDLLKIDQFSSEWTLPSMMDQNPLIWMVTFNGMIVDIRHMPFEIQEIAYKKGLIPYIPGEEK